MKALGCELLLLIEKEDTRVHLEFVVHVLYSHINLVASLTSLNTDIYCFISLNTDSFAIVNN